MMNSFLLGLARRFTEEKGLAESTAGAYVSRLRTLNNEKPPSSLSFLRKTHEIMERIKPYAHNTQKGFITAVVSSLDFVKDTNTYKKAYTFYENWLEKTTKEDKEKAKETANEMTEREAKVWMPWSDVLSLRSTQREIVLNFCRQPKLNETQYNELLKYFVLCLYTCMPPRRNLDYQLCYIVGELEDSLSKERNYLSLADEKFIFNVFKTAKTEGTQEYSFEPDTKDNEIFVEALRCYLTYHPSLKGRKGKKFSVPLLVDFGGSPLIQNNAITRILNSVFGKKIGSSMLRHMYLSGKYGGVLAEMKADSKAMSHSLDTQRAYIRNERVEDEDAKAVLDVLKEIESS